MWKWQNALLNKSHQMAQDRFLVKVAENSRYTYVLLCHFLSRYLEWAHMNVHMYL